MPALAEDSLRKAEDPGFSTNPEKIEGTVNQMADAMEHVAHHTAEGQPMSVVDGRGP